MLCLLSAWPLAAQPAPTPQQAPSRAYLPNLASEDWSFLRDGKYRSDFWDPVKYIPLKREDWYVTLGGEIRLRPEGFRVRGGEGQKSTVDNYFLQRYLFSADLHMGRRFRFFGEMQSGLISGKIASPRPTDKNIFEVHQGFLEYRSPAENARRLTLRVGRQELSIGSSRLISASQGLNVKRSFDGILANYSSRQWLIEAGAARLVKINPGVFDDPPDPEQTFWGVAIARRAAPIRTSGLGLYYLGIDRKLSQYVQGIGPERRHTIGGKFNGVFHRLDFNYDVILQWGTFRTASVKAWAISTDTGVRLNMGRLRPRIGASLNTASGDKDPNDNRLESFNPLFPGNAYSGLVGLLGPTNLTDLTPSFRIPLHPRLLVAFESPFYWRQSTSDGIYGIDLRLLIPNRNSAEHFVGANPGAVVSWQFSRHINLTGAITRFQSGPFLKGTFVQNGFGFYSLAATYRF